MAERSIVVLDWHEVLAGLENNGATPRDPGRILDADGNEIDNGWSWEVGRGYLKDALKSRSLADAVDRILRALAPGDCIRSLAFAGHGRGGLVSVGDGSGWQAGKHLNGNQAAWGAQLRRLCGRFCAGDGAVEILLMGCSTGVCDEGAAKLHELARFFAGCAPGVRGGFRVYGTRRDSAEDVRDALTNGRRDHLVSVASDVVDVPGCLTPLNPGDGLKKKEKGKERKEKPAGSPDEQVRLGDRADGGWPRPDPRRFTAVAFRDVAAPASSVALPLSPPISVADFLGLFDFARAFEPSGLPSKIDGEALLLRARGEPVRLTVTLGCTAIVYRVGREGYLYLLRDVSDRGVVRDLLRPPAGGAPCEPCPCGGGTA